VILMQEILRGLNGKGILLSQKEYRDLFVSDLHYVNGFYQFFADGEYYLGHEGSNGPFYGRVLICIEKNFGFVILANSGDKRTIERIQSITNSINRELIK